MPVETRLEQSRSRQSRPFFKTKNSGCSIVDWVVRILQVCRKNDQVIPYFDQGNADLSVALHSGTLAENSPTCPSSRTGVRAMITTCLVSNYQHAPCIRDAFDSALGQTLPFDEIIVVADGSTEWSAEPLSSASSRPRIVQVVDQDNHDALARFKQGVARATGDILFLLDAADVYAPTYVQQVLQYYRRDRRCDLVLCGHRRLGQEGTRSGGAENHDLDTSGVLAAYARGWIGTPPSCLSMRRDVMQKILTLPFPPPWCTRVADCLAFGATLVRARKCSLSQPLVYHRQTGEAQFVGRATDKLAIHQQDRRAALPANVAAKPRPWYRRQAA